MHRNNTADLLVRFMSVIVLLSNMLAPLPAAAQPAPGTRAANTPQNQPRSNYTVAASATGAQADDSTNVAASAPGEQPNGSMDVAANVPERRAAAGQLLQYRGSDGQFVSFSAERAYFLNDQQMVSVAFVGGSGVAPVGVAAIGGPRGEIPAPGLQPYLGRVTYTQLWPGVTLVYEATKSGAAKSTYTLKPGANVADIALRYNSPVSLQADGSLRIALADGQNSLSESGLVAWQDLPGGRKPVEVGFQVAKDGTVGFRVGVYDHSQPLVIDPIFIWQRVSGGGAIDRAMVTDSDGSLYVDIYSNGHKFIKYAPGGQVVWSVSLDYAFASFRVMQRDAAGNFYLTGTSSSWNGPQGQLPLNSVGSHAVLKLDPAGNYLWHTLYGSTIGSLDLSVMSSGDLVIGGTSKDSWDGPGSTAPLTPHSPGLCNNQFALKLTTDGAYQWHSFYGACEFDIQSPYGVQKEETFAGVKFDAAGNIYLVGTSKKSWNGPGNAAPLEAFAGLFGHMSVTKLATNGAYQWHTFVSGAGIDSIATAVAIDAADKLYITGVAYSFAGTPIDYYHDPIRPNNHDFAQIVIALDSNGAYLWHTYFGSFAGGSAITLANGAIYLLGYDYTGKNNPDQVPFASPALAFNTPYQSSMLPQGQMYLLKLSAEGNYRWHTFLTGTRPSGTDRAGITVGGRYVNVTLPSNANAFNILPLPDSNFGNFSLYQYYDGPGIQILPSNLGSVSATPPSSICTSACGVTYPTTTTVTLQATTVPTTTFAGWGGACSSNGSNPTCTLEVDKPLLVTAPFRYNAASTLTSTSGTLVTGQYFDATYTVDPVAAPAKDYRYGTVQLNPSGPIVTTSSIGTTCTGSAPTLSCLLRSPVAGTVVITSTYSGNDDLAPNSKVISRVVGKADTGMTITNPDPTSLVAGQPITLTYRLDVVSPGSGVPTGSVTLSNSGVSATCPISGTTGSCSIAPPQAGSSPITARYNGDANYNAGQTTTTYTVTKADTTTSISVTPSGFSEPYQPLTITASVVSKAPGTGSPDGSITVTNNLGDSCTLVSGASCVITPADFAALVFTASYPGSAGYNVSQASITHIVGRVGSTPAYARITGGLAAESVVGQRVSVTYAVTSTITVEPAGTVTLLDGEGNRCTGTIAAGSCMLPFTSAGVKGVRAYYSGSATVNPAAAASVAHTVGKADVIVDVAGALPAPSVIGQDPVKVYFNVAGKAPGSGTPSGQVNVSDNDGNTCTATVAIGFCVLPPSPARDNLVGTKTITASYLGDTNYKAGTGSAAHVVVDMPPANLSLTSRGPSPLLPDVPLTVTLGAGTNVLYTWDFGNGRVITSTTTLVRAKYGRAGTYTVTVTASNPRGTVSTSGPVTVVDMPVVGLNIITEDNDNLVDEIISFTANDTSGTGTKYTWNFGDGSPPVNGATVARLYSAAGRYTVTLTARNSAGSVTATAVQTIRDPVVGLKARGPDTARVGETLAFTATVESGLGVTYRWNFGDGSPAITGGTIITHTFARADDYSVRVTASNLSSSLDQYLPLQITNMPPGGANIATSAPIPVDSTAYFTATLTRGSDVTYYWDFGDGTSANSPSPSTSHVYSPPSTISSSVLYTATLTIRNDTGRSITEVPVIVYPQRQNRTIAGMSVYADRFIAQSDGSVRAVGNIIFQQETGRSLSWNPAKGGYVDEMLPVKWLRIAVVGTNAEAIFNTKADTLRLNGAIWGFWRTGSKRIGVGTLDGRLSTRTVQPTRFTSWPQQRVRGFDAQSASLRELVLPTRTAYDNSEGWVARWNASGLLIKDDLLAASYPVPPPPPLVLTPLQQDFVNRWIEDRRRQGWQVTEVSPLGVATLLRPFFYGGTQTNYKQIPIPADPNAPSTPPSGSAIAIPIGGWEQRFAWSKYYDVDQPTYATADYKIDTRVQFEPSSVIVSGAAFEIDPSSTDVRYATIVLKRPYVHLPASFVDQRMIFEGEVSLDETSVHVDGNLGRKIAGPFMSVENLVFYQGKQKDGYILETVVSGFTITLPGEKPIRIDCGSTYTGFCNLHMGYFDPYGKFIFNTIGTWPLTPGVDLNRLTMKVGDMSVTVKQGNFSPGGVTAPSATACNPAETGGNCVEWQNFKLDSNGISVNGAQRVPLPNQTYGDTVIEGLTAEITLSGDPPSLTPTGTTGQARNTKALNSAPIPVTISNNRTPGVDGRPSIPKIETPDLKLRFAFFDMVLDKPQLRADGSKSAQTGTISVAPEYQDTLGAVSITIYDTVIDPDGLPNFSKEYELPGVKVGNYRLAGLSGKIYRNDENGYDIRAQGGFQAPNMKPQLGKYGGCNGIAASVTFTVDAKSDKGVITLGSPRFKGLGLTAYCGIPIDTTGFSITQIRGSFELTTESFKISLGMTIESDDPIPQVGLDVDISLRPQPFDLTLIGVARIFTIKVSELKATVFVNDKGKGFAAELTMSSLVFESRFRMAAWFDSDGFNFVASARAKVRITKGAILKTPMPFPDLPPWEIELFTVGVDGGRFKNKQWGFKGYVQLPINFGIFDGIEYRGRSIGDILSSGQFGFYLDATGSFEWGNVSTYILKAPPGVSWWKDDAPVLKAAANQQPASAPQLASARLSPTFQSMPSQRSAAAPRLAAAPQLVGAPLAAATTLTDTANIGKADVAIFSLGRLGDGPTLSLYSPNGTLITPDALPANVGYMQVPNYYHPNPLVAPTGQSNLRVAVALPAAAGLTIQINGAPFAANLADAAITSYTTTTAGAATIVVRNAAGAAIASTSITLRERGAQTLALSGQPSAPDVQLIDDSMPPLPPTSALIRLVNLAPSTDGLRLHDVDGFNIVKNVAYQNASGYREVAAGLAPLDVRESNAQRIRATLPDTVLVAGQAYTVFALPGGGAVLQRDTLDTTRLRVVNATPTRVAVDVFVTVGGSEARRYSNLAYGVASDFLPAAGATSARITPVGDPATTLARADLTLGADSFTTLAVAPGAGGTVTALLFADSQQVPERSQARLRVVNLGTAPVSARRTTDGLPLARDLAAGSAAPAQSLAGGTVPLELRGSAGTLLLGLPAANLRDGQSYTLFAIDGAGGVLATDMLTEKQTSQYYFVEKPQPGAWLTVLDNVAPDSIYGLQVSGVLPPPIVENFSVTPNATALDANFTLRNVASDTVITLFANNGPITYTQQVQVSADVSETQTLDNFEGRPILHEATLAQTGFTAEGVPQTVNASMAGLPSGTYRIWISVDDGKSPPTRRYANQPVTIAPLNWNPNWTTPITVTPSLQSLTLAWPRHLDPDVREYAVVISGPTIIGTDVITVGDDLETTLSALTPGQTYTLSLRAHNLRSGNVASTPAVTGVPLAAPLTLRAPGGNALSMGAGQTLTTTLLVSSPLSPYPQSAGLDATVPPSLALSLSASDVTPTVAGTAVQAVIRTAANLRPGVYQVPLTAQGVGETSVLMFTITVGGYPLQVALAGEGSGQVTDIYGNIACGITCTVTLLPNATVTLQASPLPDSTFVGWGGACTGSAVFCTVALSTATNVTATFEPRSSALRVAKVGNGAGEIALAPAQLVCTSACSTNLTSGAAITLTATIKPGSQFAGWSGACSGVSETCSIKLGTTTMVTATFVLPPILLEFAKLGDGSGSVASTPPGLICGNDCTTDQGYFEQGTSVSLLAIAAEGSYFVDWGGACTAGMNPCAVTLDQARSVTAIFKKGYRTFIPLVVQTARYSSKANSFTSALNTQQHVSIRRSAQDAPIAPPDPSIEGSNDSFIRPLFIYSDAKSVKEQPQVAQFIDFYLDRVNMLIRDVGYFPERKEALIQARQTLAKLRA